MPMFSRRPRFGRVLDVVVVTLLLFVFLGLALYHYRRLDRSQFNAGLAKELAEQKFSNPTTSGYDWTQWRGPNRDGISTETHIITAWPTEGPKVLWEQKTGDGFASVAVVKGRLFTIFQDGDNEVVVCWDAESGKEYWRFSYESSFKNYYGSGPRSTPSVDGDHVYTVGGNGVMHCLKVSSDNPKGEAIWTKDLLKEFGAQAPKWGVSFSPLVEGDRVYIMPGGPAGNSLAALDKRTGAILWKQHDDLASYSSPIAAAIHGEKQILFLTGNRLISVNPDTGDQRWDYPWPVENECNIATPIVANDYVFISASYGRGCALLKIEKVGNVFKPAFVFKNSHMKNHFSTSVRHQNHLYGFDDSTLTCMNFQTGKVAWTERGQARGYAKGFDKGSVLLVNDHLIVYGASGVLALAEANPEEYVEKARFQFSDDGKSCWSLPVVSNGRLYVRDQKKLACFDVKK